MRVDRTHHVLFDDLHIATLTSTEKDVLRTPHSIVDALRVAGEISEEKSSAAIDALGPENHPPSQRAVARDSLILCSAGVLEWLATGGVLGEAVRTFRLHLDQTEYDTSIKAALAGYEQNEADCAWLSQLTERITNGLEAGTYQLLPAFRENPEELDDSESTSLDFRCLKDLFQFVPTSGDVIWIDDRCINRYFQRDGARIIDSLDVIYLLEDRGLLVEGELRQLTHRLRRSGARYLAIDKDEIVTWLQRATIADGEIVESHELRTIRRNFAYSLLDCEALIITSDNIGAPLEWAFILASGAAILDALVAIWSGEDADDLKLAKANWVFQSLYVPDRGRAFTNAERSEPVDLQLEAAVLAGFLVASFGVEEWRKGKRQSRRQFLSWIYGLLIRDRFDADPVLATTSIDIAKRMLLQTAVAMPGKDQRIAGVLALLLKSWLEDLPDPMRDVFGQDSGFCARLGITVLPMVQMGAHKIAPEEFWNAATRALRENQSIQLKSETGNIDVTIRSTSAQKWLAVEDRSTMQRFDLRDVPTGLLSDSVGERYASAQLVAHEFDLRRRAAEDASARLAQIESVSERMGEFIALRRKSLPLKFAELLRKLRAHEPVENSDFLPEESTLVTQYLRIDEISNSDDTFSTKFERAAEALLDDVGVGEALSRLSGIPARLPLSIVAKMTALSPEERRTILKDLIRASGRSPIVEAHLVRLIGRFVADYPAYARYQRVKIRKLSLALEAVPGAAWLEVLKYFAREFWYVKGFRLLEKAVRLAVVWAHADQVFRTMTQAGVDLAWVKERFSEMSWKLAPQFVSGEEDYVTDVGNPERLEVWPLTLALVAFASEEGQSLTPEIRAELSQRSISEAGKITLLFQNLGLAPNAMESMLQPNHNGDWSSVLDPQLVEKIVEFGSAANLRELMSQMGSDSEPDSWLALHATIGDLPIPTELLEDIRQALFSTDVVGLYEKNWKVATLAIGFASKHSAQFGGEMVQKTRGRLLELALAFHQGRLVADETMKGQLLSMAFYLYSRGGDTSKYSEIADLISELIKRWPAIAPYSKKMVDRLVDEIPNRDSRHLWKLQVVLRRL